MKPIIPKSPEVPQLTNDDIKFLTHITFGEKIPLQKCDALFVFSGTHPGHWEVAIDAFRKNFTNKIIVTGGKSLTGVPHPDWNKKNLSEAEIIIRHLLDGGIPEEIITYENQSTNTLENVLYAKKVFDFSSIDSLMFICKSHVTERQRRTLAKHLPDNINYIPYTFDAQYKNNIISRDTWMNSEEGQSRVWGEYLRILHYGEKGDLLKIDLI